MCVRVRVVVGGHVNLISNECQLQQQVNKKEIKQGWKGYETTRPELIKGKQSKRPNKETRQGGGKDRHNCFSVITILVE